MIKALSPYILESLHRQDSTEFAHVNEGIYQSLEQ